jgi:hypothetical protein
MWELKTEQLEDGRGMKLRLFDQSSAVTYGEVLQLWQDDADFRMLFNEQLANAPYVAFRWETPAVTSETANQAFEFVILNSPNLDRSPNPQPCAEHFVDAPDKGPTPGVIEFANLGKDAIMIVPCPVASPSAYAHIGSFVCNAPDAQKHALWKCVGAAMTKRLSDKPIWLSTAGAGVAWLHVRLDDRPKYYGFGPYRQVNL